MPSREELLSRAKRPAEEAMRLHPRYRGKRQMMPKCAIRRLADFAIWYTPGVAAPCQAIQREPELVYEYTNKANSIAIVSDGTRVLGLGNIGPEAGCRLWRASRCSLNISAAWTRCRSACEPRIARRSSAR